MAIRFRGNLERALSDFTTNIRQRALPNTAIALTQRLYDNLRISTPVDTGFLRQNWNATLDPNLRDTFGIYSRSATFPDVNRFSINIRDFTTRTRSLYVYNATEYGVGLNYGDEARSPRLFVQAAINRTRTIS